MAAIDPIKPKTLPTAPTPVSGSQPAAAAASSAPVYALDTAELTVPQAPDTSGLTAEEAGFVEQGFLPANFAALRAAQKEGGTDAAKALARQGKKGPFESRYGDPNLMLDAARRWTKNPELAKLVKNIQPGDLVCVTWNKKDDVISKATKGPFIHVLVCVQGGPPPEFVEALGVSGDVKDPTSNKVLRSQMLGQGYNSETVRVLRPTEGMDPTQAQKAIQRAIKFAEDQLGKPYDFSFKNDNGTGMSDAYYCSELAWKAYNDPKGADLPIRLDKSSNRDESVGALNQVLTALGTKDPNGLAYEVMQVAANPPVDEKALVKLLSDKVIPNLDATKGLAKTPEQRAALQVMLERVVKGDVFHGLTSKLQKFQKDEGAGRFKGFLGFFRRVGAGIGIGVSAIKDARDLTKGVGFWRSLRTTWKVTKILTPHLQTLTTFLFGENDPRTKQVKSALDVLDGLARDAHHVPLVGKFWPLPERARPAVNRDFVSPTDLAWADLPHYDYNVKPETPIDKELAAPLWK